MKYFKIKHLNEFNTYIKLTVLLLTCSIVPAVISSSIYSAVYMKRYEEQLFKSRCEQLDYLRESYNSYISGSESVASEVINNYQYYTNTHGDVYKLSTAKMQQLMNFNNSILAIKPSLNSIYIIPYNSNKLIVNTSIYDLSTFPEHNWIQSVISQEGMTIQRYTYRNVLTLNNTIEPCYTLVVPFVESGTENYSYVVVNISMRNFFYEQLNGSADKYCIFSNNGNLLYTNLNTIEPLNISYKNTSSTLKIDGVKYMLINAKQSADSVLFYSALVDEKIFFSPASSLKLIFLCILFVSLAISILLSVFLSKKIYQPVVDLFDKLINPNEVDDNIDEDKFASIEKYIDDFKLQKSKNYKHSLEYALQQVLHNDLSVITEIAPDYVKNKVFAIFAIEYYGFQNSAVSFIEHIKNYITIIIEQTVDFEIFDVKPNKTVVLLIADIAYSDKFSEKSLRILYSGLYSNITSYTKSAFICSSGIISLQSIYTEYLSVLGGLSEKIYCKDPAIMLFTNEISKTTDLGINSRFFFFQSNLFIAIKSKDMDLVCKHIDELFTHINTERISADSLTSWLTVLRDGIFDIPSELGYSSSEVFYKDIDTLKIRFTYCKTLSDYKIYFTEMAQITIMGLSVRTSQKHVILINNIKEYISNNLDKDTSLNIIADMYSITPQYLSMLFKRDSGESFINYLTRKKIEKSMELLSKTTISPAEISNSVGYSNTRSFYAAFKKHVGVTPIEYRKKNQIN